MPVGGESFVFDRSQGWILIPMPFWHTQPLSHLVFRQWKGIGMVCCRLGGLEKNCSWMKEDVCLKIFRTSVLMSESLSNALLDVRENRLVAISMGE